MKVYCQTCEALLLELSAPCSGTVRCCSSTIRFVADVRKGADEPVWPQDFKLMINDHSRDGYNPFRIWNDNSINMIEKEAKLKRHLRLLKSLSEDHMLVIDQNRAKTERLIADAGKVLLNSVVADSFKEPKTMFDGLTVKWEDKGKMNLLWMTTIRMYAGSQTTMTATEIEDELRSVFGCVRFARKHGLEVPQSLKGVK